MYTDQLLVRLYNREKTIADCFKFRSRLGMDKVLLSLKQYLKSPDRDLQLLKHYAGICRVANVMRPYVESLK